jgi:hypothetical protein
MANVAPKLWLAVLCQHVEFDANGLPFSLQEPLHTAVLPDGADFPFVPATMALYAQLQDALGVFHFRVELRNESGFVVCDTRPPVTIRFEGTTYRADPTEVVFNLKDFRFPAPGRVSFT